jgi:NADH:ubiquinone oxidoreductase subunit E
MQILNLSRVPLESLRLGLINAPAVSTQTFVLAAAVALKTVRSQIKPFPFERDTHMGEGNSASSQQPVEIDYMELDTIIDKQFSGDKENLIMILQAIQKTYNYLPEASLRYLAEKIDVPISTIFGVGTFYSTFSLEPRGKHIISVCLGTACHVRGAEKVRERIQEALHIRDGNTTEDMLFTLESVRCLGCCSLGPVVRVDDDIHGRITSDMAGKIVEKYH